MKCCLENYLILFMHEHFATPCLDLCSQVPDPGLQLLFICLTPLSPFPLQLGECKLWPAPD